MAIYLPSSAEEEQLALDELTPREIVAELDKYVVGQKDAKRAVAIALRNRMRRQKLDAGTGRRNHSQEHHHDRPDRRGQNRDRPPPGQAGQFAVPESRGLEVHRSRLRGPRCRVHDPRSGRDRHRQCARREAGRRRRQGRTERRRAAARHSAAAYAAYAVHRTPRRRCGDRR